MSLSKDASRSVFVRKVGRLFESVMMAEYDTGIREVMY